MRTDFLRLSVRKKAFRELVDLQDAGQLSVVETQRIICEKYGIGNERLKLIIGEGLAGCPNWLEEYDEEREKAGKARRHGPEAVGDPGRNGANHQGAA